MRNLLARPMHFRPPLSHTEESQHLAPTCGLCLSGVICTPGEMSRLTLRIAAPVNGRRGRPQLSALNLIGTACFALAALATLGLLVATPFSLGPAIRAARGQGTPGVFVAQSQQCTGSGCTWNGAFRSGRGTVLRDADYDDSAPADTHAGSSFPALWPSGSSDVYAAHGSTAWIQLVLADAVSVGILAAFLWCGPVRYLRGRERARRARDDEEAAAVASYG
jgi:hypothetical protein